MKFLQKAFQENNIFWFSAFPYLQGKILQNSNWHSQEVSLTFSSV